MKRYLQTIAITGATGKLGSSIVDQLGATIGQEKFIVTSSNEKGVQQLQASGYNARLANFNEVGELVQAFQGVDKLVVISTMEQNRFEQHKNAIDAAKIAGVQQIYYTSLAIQNIETSAVKELMISHFQTEEYLKQSGIDFTILRNTMYADALLELVGDLTDSDVITIPAGRGTVPFALRREMGEGIANLIIQDGHQNKTYNIAGSVFYSMNEIAEALTNVKGKAINYSPIDEEKYVEQLKSIGFPEFAIYLFSGTIADIKNKQYEVENVELEQFLGRPTAAVEEFIKELF